MTINDKPILVEQLFKASASEIWEAITNIDKMKLWYFENIPDFKPVIGFKTAFDVQSDTRNFHHIWTVTEVIPLKKISYKWQYSEYKGESVSHFEIEELGNEIKLSVITEIIANFTENIPEFEPESCRAGWEYFIQNRLKNYIEKTKK